MPDSDDAHDERARRTTAFDHTASDGTDAASGDDTDADEERTEVPQPVVEDAERLTHLAREAVDDDEAAAYRSDRDAQLEEYDFTARVRDDGDGETLVLHPEEWVEGGMIHPDRVDDTDRAVELSLSGTARPDDWAEVDAHNRELVEAVRDAHGDTHAAVVDALADFASNHYAKPIDDLTAAELREFRGDYVTRNTWLDDDEVAAIEESVRYAFDAAKERVPDW